MIFGMVVTPILLLLGGLVVFALIVFQMLVGLRKVHFKGKTHALVHKRGAWILLAVAAVHGFLGLLFATQLKIG